MRFPKDKGWEYSNLWANGEKPNVKGRTIHTVNYLFCLIHPIIYYCQKLVELVIAWDGKVWKSKFEWEKPSVFGKCDFDLWGKLLPKNVVHSIMPRSGCLSPCFWIFWHSAFMFFIFLTIFSDSRELSQEARDSCLYPTMILVVYLIFPMDGR